MLTVDAAAALLYDEAARLDARDWDGWLSHYRGDATFWMPAWRDARSLVEDPDTEVSLIYCSARAGLEDRVWRVRSGLSVASELQPRTMHQVGNVRLDGEGIVHAVWTCHLWHPQERRQDLLFGRYEYRLAAGDDGWKIVAKKIVLLNDRIPTMLDFYCV